MTTITEQLSETLTSDNTFPDISSLSQETSSILLATYDRGTAYQDKSVEDHQLINYAKVLRLCDCCTESDPDRQH